MKVIMGSTTRRISDSELKKLKDIQKHLERQNIKITQSELSEAIINFTIEHLNEFFSSLAQKTNENDVDPLRKWLDSPVS